MAKPSKAEILIDLARQEFETEDEKLTEADIKLFTAVANGKDAEYFTGEIEDVDPSKAEDWGPERTLNANRIVWLCKNSEASALVAGFGIGFEHVRILGEFDLSFSSFEFPLQLCNCRIEQPLILFDARMARLNLRGTHVNGINGDGLSVLRNVFLDEGFKSEREVNLSRARIGGDLNCRNGQFLNPGGRALSADGAEILGSVFLSEGFRSKGEIRLPGVKIGGDLVCFSSQFVNENATAILADRARITGDVQLARTTRSNNRFRSFGNVRLVGTTIGGNLSCRGGSFMNKDCDALNAERAQINGYVFLDEDFAAMGRVSFFGANIGAGLNMSKIATPEKCHLDLSNATLGGVLTDDESCWPAAIELSGFNYSRLEDADVRLRLKWLKRDLENGFRPDQYETLASYFLARGRPEDATTVRVAKEKRIAKRTSLHSGNIFTPQFWWYRLWGPLIGYGYQTWKALPIVAAFLVFGFFAFWLGHRNDIVTPVSGNAYADDPAPNKKIAELYPVFDPVMYTIDVFVPIIDFGQAKYWTPNPNRGKVIFRSSRSLVTAGGLLRLYMWIHIVAGWVLSTLLVIGFSGIVRE